MKNKILVLLFFLTFANIYAQQKLLPQSVGGKDRIYVIGRISIDYDYDVDYMRKCFVLSKTKKPVNKYQMNKTLMEITTNLKTAVNDPNMNNFDNNDFFFTPYRIDTKKTDPVFFSLSSTKYYLFDSYQAYLFLPLKIKFEIPKDAKYVYVGTFYYKVDPVTSKVTEIKHIDEYNQAKKWLQEQKGADAELVRVELVKY